MSERIYFKITGEFLTNISRNLVCDGTWRKAIKLLVESLDGITYDYAIQILKGESKLVGTNITGEGIYLEKENPDNVEEYLKTIQYIYGGSYQESGDKWYRPYAAVTNFGPNDVCSLGRFNLNPHHICPRAVHYADNPEDLVHMLEYMDRTTAILFKKVDLPPIWLKMPQTPQDALNEYIKLHSLEERGYRQYYGYLEKKEQTHFLKENVKEEKETKKFNEQICKLKENINAEAAKNGGFFELQVKYPGKIKTYTIPFLPFKAWSLKDFSIWKPFSPHGLKMYGDDPLHTDWIIGAGIPFESIYGLDRDEYLEKAIWDKRIEIEESYRINSVVIKGSGKVRGKIVHPKPNEELTGNEIIVVPNLSTDYYIPATKALAVITEKGGEMSHLVHGVSEHLRIIRIPDALNKYPEGITVTIDFNDNIIQKELKIEN